MYTLPPAANVADPHEPAHRQSKPGPSLLARRSDAEILRKLFVEAAAIPGEAEPGCEADYPIFGEEAGAKAALDDDDDGGGSDLTEPPSDPEYLASNGEETELEPEEARRIVFGERVTCVCIESFRHEAATKRTLWYSKQELSQMRFQFMTSPP